MTNIIFHGYSEIFGGIDVIPPILVNKNDFVRGNIQGYSLFETENKKYKIISDSLYKIRIHPCVTYIFMSKEN